MAKKNLESSGPILYNCGRDTEEIMLIGISQFETA